MVAREDDRMIILIQNPTKKPRCGDPCGDRRFPHHPQPHSPSEALCRFYCSLLSWRETPRTQTRGLAATRTERSPTSARCRGAYATRFAQRLFVHGLPGTVQRFRARRPLRRRTRHRCHGRAKRRRGRRGSRYEIAAPWRELPV